MVPLDGEDDWRSLWCSAKHWQEAVRSRLPQGRWHLGLRRRGLSGKFSSLGIVDETHGWVHDVEYKVVDVKDVFSTYDLDVPSSE